MSQDSSPHHGTLDAAVAGGLAWSAGAKWLTQMITWGSVFVAARLLSPSDFGFAEMAGFLVVFTNLLAEFGIGTAVLQMRELDHRIVTQLHTVSIAICATVFGFAISVAPLVARFFLSSRLEHVIDVASLSLFITGFQCIPQGMLQKDMDYRRLSIAEAAQAFAQAVVTVGCALLGLGYWSLIAGPLTGKAVSATLTSYWKPISFALPRWKEIKTPINLAWHVMVGRLAFAAYSQSDGIIVGRTIGGAVLGLYRMAINLATVPVEKIGMLLMRVTGPLFAKIQNDDALVRRYFLIVSESLALSTIPLTVGLALVAPEVITVFLGPKWTGAIAVLRWLAIFDTIRVMNTLIGQVLTSLRFTAFTMWMALLTSIVMPVSFLVASRWGAASVAAIWTVMAPITVGPSLVKLMKVIQLRRWDYLSALIPALVGTALMTIVVLGIRIWIVPSSWAPIGRLATEVAVGAAAYCGALLSLYRERLFRYIRFVKQIRKDQSELAMTSV